MRQQDEVRRLVDRDGPVVRRDHPELVGAVDWLLRTGELDPVLPGVYARPGAGEDFLLRVHALSR